MTRMDSVRAATGTAKDSVLHAAEMVAPYAGTAKDQAVRYAHGARARLAPKMSYAARQARETAIGQYDAHLQPRIRHARQALPPRVDAAATRAAKRARKVARQAADYTGPKLEHAKAAAEPAREEAIARGAAAVAALRGQVSPAEIKKLVKRRGRRARAGRAAKRFMVLSAMAGAAVAGWKWWNKQANPDWLVEPPAATELGDRPPLTSVDGSGQSALDPEVQARQAESGEGDDQR